MAAPYSRITSCRGCGGAPLEPVLSLGETPLANALLTAEALEAPEPRFPLTLAFCPRCSLAQILETVPPPTLFTNYPYFSSYSETMLAHAREFVSQSRVERRLSQNSFVVEIASNDGYLLQYFQQAGVRVLGIEPAENVATVAREQRQIPTCSAFFDRALAEAIRVEHGSADLVVANNVLAHVPDLPGFVSGIRTLLRDDGRASIEVPYVREMLERCEFDTIYHEHLCYFSVTALDRLFAGQGLQVVDVERLTIHGGSIRVWAAHPGAGRRTARLAALLAEERSAGLTTLAAFRSFSDRVALLRGTLRELLNGLKRDGQRIAAYGAAAKGSTLLNYCSIDGALIDFVVDRSPYKQGRYMPGVHLPIYSPARLLEEMPDYVLLLTWNFAQEIVAQQREYHERGGRFILPVPEPALV